MSHLIISPPDPSEYAAYFGRYITLVHGNDIITALTQQLDTTLPYLRSIPASRENYQYAPGKWTIKQVVAHILDSERLFAYRALSFARSDAAPLPGMEQDEWMDAMSFDGIRLADLITEFEYIRRSTILFFKNLTQDAWMRKGVASGNPFTVRSVAYIIAGHELHHLGVLKTQYK